MLEMLKLPDVRDRIRSLQYIQTFASKQKELLEEVSVSGEGPGGGGEGREGGKEGGREGGERKPDGWGG